MKVKAEGGVSPWVTSTVLLLALAFPTQGAAQRLGGGSLKTLPAAEVDALREDIKNGRWSDAMHGFFGDTLYDPTLLDLVVYVPRWGPAAQQLIHGAEATNTVAGQDALYVLVLSDVPPEERDSAAIHVAVRSLQQSNDPFLTAFVKAMAGLLKGPVPDPQVGTAPDSSMTLRLEEVGRGSLGHPLFAGMGRVRISMNSRTRVSISPLNGYAFPTDRSLHYQFRNSAEALFGVSLGGGMTFDADRPVLDGTTEVGRDNPVRAAMYLVGHLFVGRPHLPTDQFSWGLAVGTNVIAGSPLDDLVFGISAGRVEGLGIIGGLNWIEWDHVEGDPALVMRSRRLRPFVALDFRL